jgi:predicted dehydrogenase
MRTLRIAIVGGGYIAGVHSAAYRAVRGTFPESVPSLDLVGVADTDESRARALCDAWEWKRAAADWRELTTAADVDVVDVCLPNHLHADVAIDALANGKHVICEKPLAHNADGARAMAEAAAQSDRLAQVCFYYRLWPAIAFARDLVRRGEIGEPKHFRGWMLQDYASDPNLSLGWRARRDRAGAGALGDLGSHIIDVARSVVADVIRVCGVATTTVRRPGGPIDDLDTFLVEFASGATGVLECGWTAMGHKCDLGFDLIGEHGAIRFSWERSNEVEFQTSRDDGFRRVLIGPDQDPLGGIIAVAGQGVGYRDAFTIGLGAFLGAVAAGADSVLPSFDDGLAACRVVEAVQRSIANDGWTSVA